MINIIIPIITNTLLELNEAIKLIPVLDAVAACEIVLLAVEIALEIAVLLYNWQLLTVLDSV